MPNKDRTYLYILRLFYISFRNQNEKFKIHRKLSSCLNNDKCYRLTHGPTLFIENIHRLDAHQPDKNQALLTTRNVQEMLST